MKVTRMLLIINCFALLVLLMGCANEVDKSFEEAKALYAQGNYDGRS